MLLIKNNAIAANKCIVDDRFLLKAELLQEGIFFLIHLFAQDVLVMKMSGIEETKTT